MTINPIINIIRHRGMKHNDVTYTLTIPLAGLINKDKPFAGRCSGRLQSLPLLPFEYGNTAARPPGNLESMPLFSSVSCCKAFSFQGCSISLLPCLLLWAALWLWCPVWGSRDVGSGQVLIYAAAVVCEALQRVYSNSLCLPCAITQKAKHKP